MEIEAKFYNEKDILTTVAGVVDEGQKGISYCGLKETPDDETEIILLNDADLTDEEKDRALESLWIEYKTY